MLKTNQHVISISGLAPSFIIVPTLLRSNFRSDTKTRLQYQGRQSWIL